MPEGSPSVAVSDLHARSTRSHRPFPPSLPARRAVRMAPPPPDPLDVVSDARARRVEARQRRSPSVRDGADDGGAGGAESVRASWSGRKLVAVGVTLMAVSGSAACRAGRPTGDRFRPGEARVRLEPHG